MKRSIRNVDFSILWHEDEMLRLAPGGYANTAILVRPNGTYHTATNFLINFMLHHVSQDIEEVIN